MPEVRGLGDEAEPEDRMIHTHCNVAGHFETQPACCWCGLGLREDEVNWQEEHGVPRTVFRGTVQPEETI